MIVLISIAISDYFAICRVSLFLPINTSSFLSFILAYLLDVQEQAGTPQHSVQYPLIKLSDDSIQHQIIGFDLIAYSLQSLPSHLSQYSVQLLLVLSFENSG